MVAAGNDSVVMEATSTGWRRRDAELSVRRRRDDHGDERAPRVPRVGGGYHAAKARLFEEAPLAILNADEPTYAYFRERARDRFLTYAIDADADVRARDLVSDADGSRFTLHAPSWSGECAAADAGPVQRVECAGCALGRPGRGDRPGGRRRRARAHGRRAGSDGADRAGQPFGMVVDYAHTADSLAKVLRTCGR